MVRANPFPTLTHTWLLTFPPRDCRCDHVDSINDWTGTTNCQQISPNTLALGLTAGVNGVTTCSVFSDASCRDQVQSVGVAGGSSFYACTALKQKPRSIRCYFKARRYIDTALYPWPPLYLYKKKIISPAYTRETAPTPPPPRPPSPSPYPATSPDSAAYARTHPNAHQSTPAPHTPGASASTCTCSA